MASHFPLLVPRDRHRPGQVFELHALRLSSVEMASTISGARKRQVEQAVDEAAGEAFGLGQFGSGTVFSFFQQPSPAVRADEGADHRLVRMWPRRRPGIATIGGDDHLATAVASGAAESEEWRACRDYLYGIDLFNHGYYWEAHEVWEGLWVACGRRGPTAIYLQALISLCRRRTESAIGERSRYEGERR